MNILVIMFDRLKRGLGASRTSAASKRIVALFAQEAIHV